MSLCVNILYTGKGNDAISFAEEMISAGIVDMVRGEEGNLGYDYFVPMDRKGTVLLIDKWENQAALDLHHKSDIMKKIAILRGKYHLSMRVERYISEVKQ